MKKIFFPLMVALVMVVIMGSCSTSKQVTYFQNIDTISLAASRIMHDAKIMPKDQLTITVSTTNPEAAAPFNLSQNGLPMTTNNGGGNQVGMKYDVDGNGDINFPIIGVVHVLGLTKNECQNLIRQRIMPYMTELENPIVTVTVSSFRVTVLGEVNHPGVFSVPTERISILEAIAQAGDLSIYGRRENVILLREAANGEKSHVRLDLTDANIINSPYYYLQQNDAIYVEPNKSKARNANFGPTQTLWFSFIGIATSLASFVIQILK